jgi:hypothetical protein
VRSSGDRSSLAGGVDPATIRDDYRFADLMSLRAGTRLGGLCEIQSTLGAPGWLCGNVFAKDFYRDCAATGVQTFDNEPSQSVDEIRVLKAKPM